MRPIPKVADHLYSLNTGNAVGRGIPPKLTPVVVRRVGRKYFFVSYFGSEREMRHNLEDWKGDYDGSTYRSQLYATEAEWEEKSEADKLFRKIGKKFEPYQRPPILSLGVLRQIDALISD